jgi:site-specific DNA-cytosine methylase
VAGFSCVDFSALNQLQKSLDQRGESGQTLYGILGYASHHRPPLVILENVRNAPWAEIAKKWENIGYASMHVTADTKTYYLPQTRERGYMVCIAKERIAGELMTENVTKSWSKIFQCFKRQASSPLNKFILDEDDIRLEQIQRGMASRTAGNTRAVINWSKYQSRHQSYRLNADLGYKRPLTRYQDNGICKMPDFAWQEWSKVQPERIWDTLDMNYLRSLPMFDMNYKQYDSRHLI